tara:strand:- start:166 stop:399 length:234 start_codon:yes stop_codon:yes gene_type:complete
MGKIEYFEYYQVINSMNGGKVTTGLSKEKAEQYVSDLGMVMSGPFIGSRWNPFGVEEDDIAEGIRIARRENLRDIGE